MKNNFLKYLGEKDSLTGYQKSYKLILFKYIFEIADVNGFADIELVIEKVAGFYLERKKIGRLPDIDADKRIANIEHSSLYDIFTLMKLQPYKVIHQKGYLDLKCNNNGKLCFSLPVELVNNLSAVEYSEIIAILDRKIRLYFSKIDNDQLNIKPESEGMHLMESKVIGKLTEILANLDSLEKQYRNEYYSAVDIENLDTAKQVQDVAFEKIRSVKSWKADVENLTLSINKSIETLSMIIAQPESVSVTETTEKSNESKVEYINSTITDFEINFNDVSSNQEPISDIQVDKETKVGKYIKSKMTDLSHSGYIFNDETLQNMQSKEWSNQVLALNYPFVKVYNPQQDITMQTRDNRGYARYWSKIYAFKNCSILVCSQWVENHREIFDRWYNSLVIVPLDIKANIVSMTDNPKDDVTSTHESTGHAKKDPCGFKLFGKSYTARYWNEILIKVCEIMLLKKPYIVAKFDKEEALNSEQRTNFSYNESDIKFNKKKLSNGLWLETNRSANDVASVCKKILKLCGYDEDELSIDVEQSENELSTEEMFRMMDKIENSEKQIESNGEIQQVKEYSRFIFKDEKQIELIEKTFLEYIKKEDAYKQSRIKLYMYFIMALNLGLRVSDMLSLKFCNIIENMDLENGIINYRNEVGIDIQENTKNNRKNRHITINETVKKVITLYLDNFRDTKVESFLFPNQAVNANDKNKPMSLSAIDDALKKFDKRSGLNLGLNSNSLRRTFGYRYYIDSGHNYEALFELQEIFGHASIPVTLKYIGITNEMVASAYNTQILGE